MDDEPKISEQVTDIIGKIKNYLVWAHTLVARLIDDDSDVERGQVQSCNWLIRMAFYHEVNGKAVRLWEVITGIVRAFKTG